MVRIQAFETIARVRAQLLHILYEIGREDHQFRIRYKGQYLRDAYTIEDYNIIDNSIIKMVPLSKRVDVRIFLEKSMIFKNTCHNISRLKYKQLLKVLVIIFVKYK